MNQVYSHDFNEVGFKVTQIGEEDIEIEDIVEFKFHAREMLFRKVIREPAQFKDLLASVGHGI